jgi:flagellar protein FliO/FliZ
MKTLRAFACCLAMLGGASTALAETSGAAVADLSGVLASLSIVVAVILVGAFVVRRTPLFAVGRRNDALKVVAALPLGPKERLLLVRARDVEWLIAVSPAGVFKLARSSLRGATDLALAGAGSLDEIDATGAAANGHDLRRQGASIEEQPRAQPKFALGDIK